VKAESDSRCRVQKSSVGFWGAGGGRVITGRGMGSCQGEGEGGASRSVEYKPFEGGFTGKNSRNLSKQDTR